jgi:serine/threonine-protein kinase
MPNVIGQSVTDASNVIRNDGLTVGTTNFVKSDKTAGTVVSTKPSPGKDVHAGQSVTLEVSLGPSGTQVSVPNVVGMSIGDAESALRDGPAVLPG